MRGSRSRKPRLPRKRRAAPRSRPGRFSRSASSPDRKSSGCRATNILRDELLNIEIRVSSDHSTMLADELLRGKLDIAFLRAEPVPDLEFKPVAKEPLVAILPSDHRFAKQKAVDPQDFVGETYIGISNTPRVLRAIIGDYFKRRGIEIMPTLAIDTYAKAISLVES